MKGDANTNDDVKLTAKEDMFCRQYILHLNATKAAINAGYSEKTARNIGSQNLAKLHIQKRIKQMQNNLADTLELSKARIVTEHMKIAFADAGQLRVSWTELKDFEKLTDEQKAVIQEVTVKEVKFGVEIKVKQYDKQRSLDSLSAMLGFNEPVKMEHTGKDGSDLIPARILTKEEAAEYLKKLEGDY